ncbi:DNA-binding response regulator [Streptomyces sp. NPDC015131]|uniref:helix-turn-helix transcriptional regulator n=1 Tax=Streptomyces sp. NPDC015131 TaxID=3364941 RepID=UPI0036F8CEC7
MVIRKTESQPGGGKEESVDDEVGRALLEVQGLIEAARVFGFRTSSGGSVRMLESGEDVIEISGRLMEKAGQDVSVTVQTPGSEAGAVALALLGRGPGYGSVRAAAREGLQIRLLCSPAVARSAAFREALAGSPGCVVRVAECVLNEAVVLDDSVAVVWLDSKGADRSVSVVQDPASVSALAGLFGVVWNGATAWGDSASRARSATGQRILEALRDGRTDEAAARELSIPLRTYRRYVAEIMRELGASSRFQAGARAVRLRLLKNDEQ